MPRWMRGAISALTPSLVIVADIHDLQYDLGGDAIDRLQDDADFLTNGYRMARYRYGRFDPRRILTRAMTLWYWRRLRRYGWSAFRHKKET